MKAIQFNFSKRRLLAGFSLGLLLSSCSSTPPQGPTAAEQMMEASIAEAEQYTQMQNQPPSEISTSLLNNAAGLGGVSKPTRSALERFDISVNRVPARTFFLSLVADSGINVVAHPEVTGFISLELKNVTIAEVLGVTRDVYGYEYKLTNGIYTIFSRKLRTEVFPINYLDIKRVGVSDTSVSIGKISSSDSGNSNGRSSGGSSNQSDGSGSLLGYIEESKSGSSGSSGALTPGARVQTLNKTDFWGSIYETLSAIVDAGSDGRMVMTNPQSGLVVVKAMPNELSAVRDFLERSELSVKRQVVLETKILEVRLNDGFEAGIDWSAISGSLHSERVRTRGNSTLDQAGSSLSGGILSTFAESSRLVFDDTDSVVSAVLDVIDLTQLLDLLETQGNVQVLSSPRISTVNNQKAIIRVGSDEFFVTGISNNTTATAASIQNTPQIDLESFFSGIALDVTPQIAADGDVILHVHPIVSDVEDQLKEIQFGDEFFTLPLALRDVRESDSIVRARSGQVVVLGGLMQEITVDVVGKQPILGDIPVIRGLFKTMETRNVKTELVILMRPIVVDDQTWEEELLRTSNRMGLMSDEYRGRDN
ncbi:pilus (MSHA type) biogenesis protein MshL [Teredinibacter franksiae]|uniref:pilus (MSHA type) biogenesis protein MshL n=1 Tax=Teredinibacter franksiae TaxID=2761453 RepID=UPI001627A0A8|nr:pilus (MSHA type) biogenesis protein MshL [Teredinibacter franksiae]